MKSFSQLKEDIHYDRRIMEDFIPDSAAVWSENFMIQLRMIQEDANLKIMTDAEKKLSDAERDEVAEFTGKSAQREVTSFIDATRNEARNFLSKDTKKLEVARNNEIRELENQYREAKNRHDAARQDAIENNQRQKRATLAKFKKEYNEEIAALDARFAWAKETIDKGFPKTTKNNKGELTPASRKDVDTYEKAEIALDKYYGGIETAKKLYTESIKGIEKEYAASLKIILDSIPALPSDKQLNDAKEEIRKRYGAEIMQKHENVSSILTNKKVNTRGYLVDLTDEDRKDAWDNAWAAIKNVIFHKKVWTPRNVVGGLIFIVGDMVQSRVTNTSMILSAIGWMFTTILKGVSGQAVRSLKEAAPAIGILLALGLSLGVIWAIIKTAWTKGPSYLDNFLSTRTSAAYTFKKEFGVDLNVKQKDRKGGGILQDFQFGATDFDKARLELEKEAESRLQKQQELNVAKFEQELKKKIEAEL